MKLLVVIFLKRRQVNPRSVSRCKASNTRVRKPPLGTAGGRLRGSGFARLSGRGAPSLPAALMEAAAQLVQPEVTAEREHAEEVAAAPGSRPRGARDTRLFRE